MSDDYTIRVNLGGGDPEAVVKALRDHFAKHRRPVIPTGVRHCPGCTCNGKPTAHT